MTCGKCKKRHVCFIIKAFEKARDEVYPWWECDFEKLYDFIYEHCSQFELIPPDNS